VPKASQQHTRRKTASYSSKTQQNTTEKSQINHAAALLLRNATPTLGYPTQSLAYMGALDRREKESLALHGSIAEMAPAMSCVDGKRWMFPGGGYDREDIYRTLRCAISGKIGGERSSSRAF